MQKFFESLTPFLVLGFAIAISVALLFFIFQIVLWGTLIGFIAWGFAYIKARFFAPKKTAFKKRHKGRVIEHDDIF